MTHWVDQSVFYHIYPLGLCGVLRADDCTQKPEHPLNKLYPWLDHIAGMGFNALYLGPHFESVYHGYDTTDYYKVDRRLGTNADLAALTDYAHRLGIRVIFDAVFNHVGRQHFAFQDLLRNLQNSEYADWFAKVDFNQNNKHNDGFKYSCWQDHETLVNLNLAHPGVQEHLLGAVKQWVEDYHIDGLRLDAANVMDLGFLSKLAEFSHALKPQFWLLGEVADGNFPLFANPERLDSVTNYESFPALYRSFNDKNMFDISWSLNRLFGPQGSCKDLTLYSFADNHDVNRVASLLQNPQHLLPLYVLMFSMPGVPSIYYGSEFGIRGEKNPGDEPLRPALALSELQQDPDKQRLIEPLKKLIRAKRELPALQTGVYHQLHLANKQFAFSRECEQGFALTTINAADTPAQIHLDLPGGYSGCLKDILQPESVFSGENGALSLVLEPNSARLLIPA